MNSTKIVSAILILLITVLPADAVINATTVEIRGSVATGNYSWDKVNFPGFFYDFANNLGRERLEASGNLNSFNRIIGKDQLTYSTQGEPKYLNVVKQAFGGNASAARDAGLEQFGNGSMAGIIGISGAGQYTIIGWQGEKDVAVKKKPYKLAGLLLEHGTSPTDEKNMSADETWIIGGGWNLTVKSINASETPIRVTFFLTKDGIKKNDTVRIRGQIYTYVESNISNETNVPMFVTYLNNVTSSTVQFRYTWALSTNITEIKNGDKFGIMKVSQQDPIILKNLDNTVILSPDTTVNVMGDVKLKVADDANNLRYYPFVEKTTPGIYEVRGAVAFGNSSWDNATFAGFYYDIKDNVGKEKLEINLTNGGAGNATRTIGKDNMVYSTVGQPKFLQVVEKQYGGNTANAIAAGLEQFGNGSMAGIQGVSGAGQYTIIGWQGEKNVAIKKKPYKLTRLLIEHGSTAADKKTLTVGETWDIGGGWSLKLESVDAKASPRQAMFTLSKDGIAKDTKIITAGTTEAKPIYTFVEKSLGGEADVPVFVTYVDAIFAGTDTDLVQLRYTWALSADVTQINSGDTFGIMKVTQQDPLALKNSDLAVTLAPGSVINIMGELNFKVADDAANLRYYPFVTYEIPLPTPLPPTPAPFDTLIFEPKAWNFVAVPKMLVNSSVVVVFSNLTGDNKNMVWYYNATSKFWESPSGIMPLRSYWVYSNASTQITQKLYYKSADGPFVPPSILLKSGWNMIGHSSTEPMPVPGALVSIEGKYSNLLTYDQMKGWRKYAAGYPDQQEFDILEPGRGYWIFMREDATYASVDV